MTLCSVWVQGRRRSDKGPDLFLWLTCHLDTCKVCCVYMYYFQQPCIHESNPNRNRTVYLLQQCNSKNSLCFLKVFDPRPQTYQLRSILQQKQRHSKPLNHGVIHIFDNKIDEQLKLNILWKSLSFCKSPE